LLPTVQGKVIAALTKAALVAGVSVKDFATGWSA